MHKRITGHPLTDRYALVIEDSVFVYKLFDKRVKFPFFVVQMPNLSSTIPSTISLWVDIFRASSNSKIHSKN